MLVPDLTDVGSPALTRWPTFAKEAVEVGVHAAFAFPLLLGTSCVGALGLYRTEPGPMSSTRSARECSAPARWP